MKILKIVLIIIVFGIYSCNNKSEKKNKNLIEKELKTDFIRTFEGNINGEYEIMMKIISENGKIKGSYYYKKNNIKLELKGSLQSDGKIILKEFDTKGNQTGVFEGTIKNTRKIIGKWSKPNGKDEMNFSLIESNTNYIVESNINYKKLTGTYRTPKINGISYGTAKVKYLKKNTISFGVFVVTKGGNMGEIEGEMKLINGKGEYSDRSCGKLELTFNKNTLHIKTKKCMQGMNAFFDGKYEKQ